MSSYHNIFLLLWIMNYENHNNVKQTLFKKPDPYNLRTLETRWWFLITVLSWVNIFYFTTPSASTSRSLVKIKYKLIKLKHSNEAIWICREFLNFNIESYAIRENVLLIAYRGKSDTIFMRTKTKSRVWVNSRRFLSRDRVEFEIYDNCCQEHEQRIQSYYFAKTDSGTFFKLKNCYPIQVKYLLSNYQCQTRYLVFFLIATDQLHQIRLRIAQAWTIQDLSNNFYRYTLGTSCKTVLFPVNENNISLWWKEKKH